jgi:hypothetical protein
MVRIYFLALLCAATATAASRVYYLPHFANSDDPTEGLVFYFEAPEAWTATITVDIVRNGKTVTETRTIDTDRVYGERLIFAMKLDERSAQKLPVVHIVIAGAEYTIRRMEAATVYPLNPPRRRMSAADSRDR